MKYKVRSWIDRFFEKIRFTDSCWVWIGTKDRKGYGDFKLNYQHWKAHRITYLLLHGDINSELTIDHLCRNHFCVNPEHLEQVSIKTNILRGEGVCANNSRKKYCVNGHPLFGENLVIRSNNGRRCKTCHREGVKIHYYKKKTIVEITA